MFPLSMALPPFTANSTKAVAATTASSKEGNDSLPSTLPLADDVMAKGE